MIWLVSLNSTIRNLRARQNISLYEKVHSQVVAAHTFDTGI